MQILAYSSLAILWLTSTQYSGVLADPNSMANISERTLITDYNDNIDVPSLDLNNKNQHLPRFTPSIYTAAHANSDGVIPISNNVDKRAAITDYNYNLDISSLNISDKNYHLLRRPHHIETAAHASSDGVSPISNVNNRTLLHQRDDPIALHCERTHACSWENRLHPIGQACCDYCGFNPPYSPFDPESCKWQCRWANPVVQLPVRGCTCWEKCVPPMDVFRNPITPPAANSQDKIEADAREKTQALIDDRKQKQRLAEETLEQLFVNRDRAIMRDEEREKKWSAMVNKTDVDAMEYYGKTGKRDIAPAALMNISEIPPEVHLDDKTRAAIETDTRKLICQGQWNPMTKTCDSSFPELERQRRACEANHSRWDYQNFTCSPGLPLLLRSAAETRSTDDSSSVLKKQRLECEGNHSRWDDQSEICSPGLPLLLRSASDTKVRVSRERLLKYRALPCLKGHGQWFHHSKQCHPILPIRRGADDVDVVETRMDNAMMRCLRGNETWDHVDGVCQDATQLWNSDPDTNMTNSNITTPANTNSTGDINFQSDSSDPMIPAPTPTTSNTNSTDLTKRHHRHHQPEVTFRPTCKPGTTYCYKRGVGSTCKRYALCTGPVHCAKVNRYYKCIEWTETRICGDPRHCSAVDHEYNCVDHYHDDCGVFEHKPAWQGSKGVGPLDKTLP